MPATFITACALAAGTKSPAPRATPVANTARREIIVCFVTALIPCFLSIVQKIVGFAQKRVKRMDAQKTINMSVTGKPAKASARRFRRSQPNVTE
jgi:hypothetical protein